MANQTYYYNVKNRSASVVLYTIPEDNIRRRFSPGETKRISYQELLKLNYQPGGREMLSQFLQVQSEGVPKSLGLNLEPEYYMSEQQIKDLLLNGTLDAFLDCLDFAPEGVIELIKKFAIELPLSDFQKREALKAKTGLDVDKAVQNSGKEPDAAQEEAVKKAAEKPTTGRRTSTTNYKVINQG